jgi:hypothetical protein
MKKINAVITASILKQNSKYSEVLAIDTLSKCSKPIWKIHIKNLEFNFYPNQDYILSGGLWQLSMYLDIPYKEYSCDMNNNPPDELENEFGLDIFNEYRTGLGDCLNRSEVFYTIIVDTDADLINYKNIKLVNQLNESGAFVSFTKSHITNLITI